MSDLSALQTRIGYTFKNEELLRLALTHPSIAHEAGTHILLSRGEENTGGRHRPSAMADAFEALIGAIFMDGGLEPARAFVLSEFAAYVSGLASLPTIDNPKGELQELLQATSAEAPQYQMASATGPDHDRIFECTVHHGGVELARGIGKSKKDAETAAALAAYQMLKARKQAEKSGE